MKNGRAGKKSGRAIKREHRQRRGKRRIDKRDHVPGKENVRGKERGNLCKSDCEIADVTLCLNLLPLGRR